MTNAEKYFFSDFTHREYEELLQTAKRTWTFRTFDQFDRQERFILWRHDVDYSMHSALKLAQLEKEAGVVATYFILPHSEFYNLFEKEITNLVKEIIALGHEIGLHFDSHYYGVQDEAQLEKYLTQEKRWLQEVFEKEIKVFSFHNTSDFTMNCKKWEYAGLINTYADYFQTEVPYTSDSNGYWRFKRLKDVLNDDSQHSLQVLTHPEWWQEKVLSPFDKVKLAVQHRADNTLNYYVNHLSMHNRSNIDWE